MAVQDHYPMKHFGEVTDSLETLHAAAMNVLKGATNGDFQLIEQAQAEIEKSKRALKAIHAKQSNRTSSSQSEYLRRNFF